MSASDAVQAAIVSVLKAAGVAGGRVVDYDDPEDGTAFPYVQIGEAQAIGDDVTCQDGFDEFVTVHVWSRYQGAKEAKDICGAIHDALHDVALTATGRSTAHSWIRDYRVFLDADGVTRHGVVTVRVQHYD